MRHTSILALPLTWLLAAAPAALAQSTTSTTIESTTSTTVMTSTTSTVETTSTSTTVETTSTSTTVESTTTSTSVPTTTSTSTTSTTSTSLQTCDCDDVPFMAEFAAKLARGVTVRADLGVNAATGVAVVGANATMTEGTTLYANRVKIAPGAEVDDVRTNALNAADTNSINGTVDPVALPLKVPYCPMPELSCGTGDMQVTDTTTELAPGSYGKVNVGTGAILHLPGNGHYQFCELRIANGGQVLVTHQVTIDVTGNVIVGTRSSFRTGGGAPFTLRVGGSKVLLGREALVTAAITAPNAKGKVKADSTLAGCMCARVLKAAKNAQLTCAGDSGEGSPSGAFTD